MHDEPLGLTVHSIPRPQDAAEGDSRRTAIGRLKMLMVLAVCAAPVVASYFTYYVIRPEGRRNHGDLIDPQKPLPAIAANSLDGKPLQLPQLRGQWLLISVSGGACESACERHLYLQRQLREGLGKDKERLDWVWFVTDQAQVKPALLPALTQGQATILRVDPAQLGQWLAPAAGSRLEDHLYLVDPIGNWMMRFPALPASEAEAVSAKNIKRDLDRLMRAAASWDKPGRESR